MFSFEGTFLQLVLIAMRVHLFPSRTQKLSSFAPTIVAGRLAVKIGNANINLHRNVEVFSCLLSCLPKTILLQQRFCLRGARPACQSPCCCHSLLLAVSATGSARKRPPRHVFIRQNDSRFLAVKIGNANINLYKL